MWMQVTSDITSILRPASLVFLDNDVLTADDFACGLCCSKETDSPLTNRNVYLSVAMLSPYVLDEIHRRDSM